MRSVTVQVPGKVMLAGEYAVLRGGKALATTVDRHLRVRVTDAPGVNGAEVHSSMWPAPKQVTPLMTPGALADEPLAQATAAGLRRTGLSGVRIDVTSDLDPRWGLGSSSAVRLGALMALDAFADLGRRPTRGRAADEPDLEQRRWQLAREAWLLQRAAQGTASGYDVATQMNGQVLVVTPGTEDAASWPAEVIDLGAQAGKALERMVAVQVGGAGAPTTQVIASTTEWLDRMALWPELRHAGRDLVQSLLSALECPEETAARSRLFQAVARSRGLLAQAPGAPKALLAGLMALPGCDAAWSFKTTGAGGEDALLLFGDREAVAGPAAWLASAGWRTLDAALAVPGASVIVDEGGGRSS